MTLSQKIILRNVALLAGLLLVGGASLWGLLGLRSRVNDALLAYQELKTVEKISPQVARANEQVGAGEVAQAAATLRHVIPQLTEFITTLSESAAAGDSYSITAKAMGESSLGKLRD